MKRCVLMSSIVLLLGCNSQENSQQTIRSPATMPSPGPIVANLDFANWSQFPEGTTVKIKSVTSRGKVETISIETFRLAKKTDYEVVIERQNTTERNDGSYKAVNPPENRKYAKTFSLPNGMKEEDFAKPSLKAKSAGNETIEILGKKYDAEVFTWTDHTEAGDSVAKIWRSKDMPGRMIKQTIEVAGIETKTKEEVIELSIPK